MMSYLQWLHDVCNSSKSKMMFLSSKVPIYEHGVSNHFKVLIHSIEFFLDVEQSFMILSCIVLCKLTMQKLIKWLLLYVMGLGAASFCWLFIFISLHSLSCCPKACVNRWHGLNAILESVFAQLLPCEYYMYIFLIYRASLSFL